MIKSKIIRMFVCLLIFGIVIVLVWSFMIKTENRGNNVAFCVTKDKNTFLDQTVVAARILYDCSIVSEREATWIESLQLSDGSFACYEPEENLPVRVNPYFASYAALAVLESDHGNAKKDKIDAYLNWYFSNMNMSADINGSVGTIYDYHAEIRDSQVVALTCSYAYDSADSYAAVFLILLNEYFDKYEDYTVLYEEKDKIDLLVALLLSLQTDGYTESAKGSNVKYLMNNAEVYQGYKAAIRIYEKSGRTDEQTAMQNGTIDNIPSKMAMLQDAVLAFEHNFDNYWWNHSSYYSALNGNNEPMGEGVFDWSKLYESALPQLFPVMFGIKDCETEQSVRMYEGFCENWKWQNMEYLGQTEGNETWSVIVYAAMRMGDYAGVDKYLKVFEDVTVEKSYPYYSGDSVWVVLACEGIMDRYR